MSTVVVCEKCSSDCIIKILRVDDKKMLIDTINLNNYIFPHFDRLFPQDKEWWKLQLVSQQKTGNNFDEKDSIKVKYASSIYRLPTVVDNRDDVGATRFLLEINRFYSSDIFHIVRVPKPRQLWLILTILDMDSKRQVAGFDKDGIKVKVFDYFETVLLSFTPCIYYCCAGHDTNVHFACNISTYCENNDFKTSIYYTVSFFSTGDFFVNRVMADNSGRLIRGEDLFFKEENVKKTLNYFTGLPNFPPSYYYDEDGKRTIVLTPDNSQKYRQGYSWTYLANEDKLICYNPGDQNSIGGVNIEEVIFFKERYQNNQYTLVFQNHSIYSCHSSGANKVDEKSKREKDLELKRINFTHGKYEKDKVEKNESVIVLKDFINKGRDEKLNNSSLNNFGGCENGVVDSQVRLIIVDFFSGLTREFKLFELELQHSGEFFIAMNNADTIYLKKFRKFIHNFFRMILPAVLTSLILSF